MFLIFSLLGVSGVLFGRTMSTEEFIALGEQELKERVALDYPHASDSFRDGILRQSLLGQRIYQNPQDDALQSRYMEKHSDYAFQCAYNSGGAYSRCLTLPNGDMPNVKLAVQFRNGSMDPFASRFDEQFDSKFDSALYTLMVTSLVAYDRLALREYFKKHIRFFTIDPMSIPPYNGRFVEVVLNGNRD